MCVLGHLAEVKLLWTQLCMRMSKYTWTCRIFLKLLHFFRKMLSAHIFINCTSLSKFVKFVKIVSDTYLNFIKLSNISKIFWQASTKFWVFYICKVYTNSFIIFQISWNIFSMILKFPRNFSKYSSIFFSNFPRILLEINTFF